MAYPQVDGGVHAAAHRRDVLAGWALGVLAALVVTNAVAAGATEPEPAEAQIKHILRLNPNPAQGAEIFGYCAGCHGAQSEGLPAGWAPIIAGQHARYLVKQLIAYRSSQRWDPRMEPIAKGHGLRDDQDVADVVAYLAALEGEWGRDSHSISSVEASGYYGSHCRSCHGKDGSGDDTHFVPRIGGQDFAYVLRQLHDVVDGRRPNMRRQHYAALASLDVRQLVNLSRFVATLGAAAEDSVPTELNSGVRPALNGRSLVVSHATEPEARFTRDWLSLR